MQRNTFRTSGYASGRTAMLDWQTSATWPCYYNHYSHHSSNRLLPIIYNYELCLKRKIILILPKLSNTYISFEVQKNISAILRTCSKHIKIAKFFKNKIFKIRYPKIKKAENEKQQAKQMHKIKRYIRPNLQESGQWQVGSIIIIISN